MFQGYKTTIGFVNQKERVLSLVDVRCGKCLESLGKSNDVLESLEK